jgi:hypothetical protein
LRGFQGIPFERHSVVAPSGTRAGQYGQGQRGCRNDQSLSPEVSRRLIPQAGRDQLGEAHGEGEVAPALVIPSPDARHKSSIPALRLMSPLAGVFWKGSPLAQVTIHSPLVPVALVRGAFSFGQAPMGGACQPRPPNVANPAVFLAARTQQNLAGPNPTGF